MLVLCVNIVIEFERFTIAPASLPNYTSPLLSLFLHSFIHCLEVLLSYSFVCLFVFTSNLPTSSTSSTCNAPPASSFPVSQPPHDFLHRLDHCWNLVYSCTGWPKTSPLLAWKSHVLGSSVRAGILPSSPPPPTPAQCLAHSSPSVHICRINEWSLLSDWVKRRQSIRASLWS